MGRGEALPSPLGRGAERSEAGWGRRTFTLALALLLSACATGSALTINGHVKEASGGEPIEDARISLSCPEALKASGLNLLASTDASGKAARQLPSSGHELSGQCDIFVTADGYEHQTFPMQSVCSRWVGSRCVDVIVKARMKPDAGVAPGRGVTLGIEMKDATSTLSTQNLDAPIGQKATITLNRNGVPYQLTLTPRWVNESTIALEGTWSAGTGASGVVNESTLASQPVTISFGDDVVMVVTPRKLDGAP